MKYLETLSKVWILKLKFTALRVKIVASLVRKWDPKNWNVAIWVDLDDSQNLNF